ncbi:MAG TPA: hypothetical protein VEL07_11830 [Planctomycetota bacterium]|nr:hypothetical protein [Planctomycetota bacterium]
MSRPIPWPRAHVAMAAMAAIAACVSISGCGTDEAAEHGRVLARYEARRGELVITVSEAATLRSREMIFIKGQQGKIAWVIPEGSTVKAGDKVLEVTNDELVKQLDDGRLAAEKAQREAEAAVSDLKLLELENAKILDDDQRAISASRLNLEQYREGKSPLREEELKLLAERAEIDAKDAQEKYDLMPDLYARSFITRTDLRTAELNTRTAAQQLKKARREYEIFTTYENPLELSKLEAEASAALVKAERSKQMIATQLAEKQAAVRIKAHERDRQVQAVAALEKRIVDLVITAPKDGMVVYGNAAQRQYWQQDDGRLEPGADIHQNSIVMTIPNLSDMVAVANVNQLHVGQMTIGLPATSTVEGIDAVFTGEVVKVSTTASQNWTGESGGYATEISLVGGADAAFRSGMSAKVEIVVKRLPDVLLIPIDAIYQRDGQSHCYVQGEAGARRAIVLGDSNDSHAVVTSGLQPGETVEVYAVEPGG